MKDDTFQAFVLDQLRELPDVASRAMFGGFGLYCGRSFFGIVFHGRLYFKVSDATRTDYEARGMKPFRPSARQTMKSFYEVPADVVEDRATLITWATRAILPK